ncbi:MAG: NAD-dependent epimerase/dehydratase family protein [Alphaproteobacteria bacterium]
MQKDASIAITGASGLVGKSLVALLRAEGFTQIHEMNQTTCDLTNRQATLAYFDAVKPDYIFHLAAYIFGVMGNMRNQSESYLRNLLMNTHVVEASQRVAVKKITAMGTGAVYPYPPPGDPLSENMIWMGKPHDAQRGYAYSKRAMLAHLDINQENHGINYAFVVSSNLYGPHDRFNTEVGQVVPSLIRKFYEAKQTGKKISVWGNGSAQRDFMYVKDTARALRLIMDTIDGPVNLGSNHVHSIRDVVTHLATYTGQEDKVEWDASKPNGQPYRGYDLSKLQQAGFQSAFSLEQGLRETYDWYAENEAIARK